MNLTPFIQKNHTEPIYLQLYHYIRDEIEKGRLIPGTKLPSIRQLANHLQISKNTIESAYSQLIAEGYLVSKEKSGVFVTELENFTQDESQIILPETVPDTVKHIKNCIDFHYGDIELKKFPDKVWKKCLNESFDLANQEVFSYGHKQGHYGLRKEISKYLYQARGFHCSPEQIILCAGTQTAISFISQLLELPNERVALENPGYDGVRAVFQSHKCKVVPIPLEEDGINIDVLGKSFAKCVYVTPSHQFPIGMILPIQKRLKLLQWAKKSGCYIIEDDYDSEFRYSGQPIPSLKSLDANNQVIYLGTFSKAFLPAARLSYMVLPTELAERFHLNFSFYNQTVSPFFQEALYRFMKDDHLGRHIRKMRKIYQRKHKTLVDSIEKYLGNQVRIIGQNAGLHLLLEVKGVDAKDLVTNALTKEIKIYSTERFWMDNSNECIPSIMLGFGGLNEEDIHLGIQKLALALKDFQK